VARSAALAYYHVEDAVAVNAHALAALADARFRPALPQLAAQMTALQLSARVPCEWLHPLARGKQDAANAERPPGGASQVCSFSISINLGMRYACLTSQDHFNTVLIYGNGL
jgi:hypothetical protein